MQPAIILKKVPSSFLFLGGLYLLDIFLFFIFRLTLLLQHTERIHSIPWSIVIKSFFVGWRFDTAISAYLLIPVYFLVVIPWINMFRNTIIKYIGLAVIILTAGIACSLALSDLGFFKFFNSRLNSTIFEWNDTPWFSLKMSFSAFGAHWYILAFIIIMMLYYKLLIRLYAYVQNISVKPHLATALLLPIIAAALIFLGARGRIAIKAPLTWGVAYFSSYDFANQMALSLLSIK